MHFFKKIFSVLPLIFLLMGIKSQAEIVKSVDVIGNKRITLETVMVFGDITVGKDYKTSDINSLIKKLYETNYFSNISVELINGRLSITVEENPIIQVLKFEGIKNKRILELLKDQIDRKHFYNFEISSDFNTSILILLTSNFFLNLPFKIFPDGSFIF